MDKVKQVAIVTIRVTVITIIFSFITLEVLMRTLTEQSEDGITVYRGMAIRPVAMPLSIIEPSINEYLANEENAVVRYDAELGWTFPTDFDGAIITNDMGLRSSQDFEVVPDEETLRIAFFGDSFMAGGEVSDDETITFYIEEALAACETNVEIMNFGVFGYGMDQAYLRWQLLGEEYNPDMVIFGLQMENLNRNVNLARPLISAQAIPFTKPRFVLENDMLRLINSPTVPVDDLLDTYENFEDWEWSEYEWHYNERFRQQWTDYSILYRIFEARQHLTGQTRIDLTPEDERTLLGYKIIEQFSSEVTATGAEFILLHLPNRPVLERYFEDDTFSYQFMLDNLDETYEIIAAESVFTGVDPADWQPGDHYSPQANQSVANFTVDWLIENVGSLVCE